MEQNVEDGGSSKSSHKVLCRQTSSKWTPTSEQISILKEMYYNNGVRSPSDEQIQEITARLRRYGKIEGKNEYYWFQNHKAREKRKESHNTEIPMQKATAGRKCPSAFASGAQSSSACSPDSETLPLFPMHDDEDVSGFCNMKEERENYFSNGYQYHHPDASMGSSGVSLELTLNSYGCMPPSSP